MSARNAPGDRQFQRTGSHRRRKLSWWTEEGNTCRAFLVEAQREGLVMLTAVDRSPRLHARITFVAPAASQAPVRLASACVTHVEPLSSELVLVTACYEPAENGEV